MSTHAAIIEKYEDGYRGIYCHFDGYVYKSRVEDVSIKNLIKKFNYNSIVSSLISGGNIVSLGNNDKTLQDIEYDRKSYDIHIETFKHPLSEGPYYGMTVEDVAAQIKNCYYVYIFVDGTWYVDIPNLDIYNKKLEDIYEDNQLLNKLNEFQKHLQETGLV